MIRTLFGIRYPDSSPSLLPVVRLVRGHQQGNSAPLYAAPVEWNGLDIYVRRLHTPCTALDQEPQTYPLCYWPLEKPPAAAFSLDTASHKFHTRCMYLREYPGYSLNAGVHGDQERLRSA